MGCFFACLGYSKDKKGKRLHSNRGPSVASDQRRGYNPVEQVVYSEGRFRPAQRAALAGEDAKPAQRVGSPTEGGSDAPIVSISLLQNKAAAAEEEFSVGTNEFVQQEASPKKSSLASSPTRLCSRVMEKSSSGAKKKVSFNSVVITHEPLDREEFNEDERAMDVAKPNISNSDSEAGSKTSNLVSYPPKHRYQNCRESDDEEELDDEESDIDIDDSELEEDEYSDGDVLTDYSLSSMELATRARVSLRGSLEVNSHDYDYDHSVLNPVENLSQWKALKAMGKKPPLQKHPKENSAIDFNEPISNRSRSLQPKNGLPEHQAQQMAVDASLSNWLISPKPVSISTHNVMRQQTTSQDSYSHSPRSFDERPILGAMTVEELILISSRTSSPRKSPSKSPDDKTIIGSVGSYWNPEILTQDLPIVCSNTFVPNV